MAQSDELFSFLFMEENMDERHGLEAAAEPVAEFSGSFGHSFQKPFVRGEEDDDLVLFPHGEAAEDDGICLVERHLGLFEKLEKKRAQAQERKDSYRIGAHGQEVLRPERGVKTEQFKDKWDKSSQEGGDEEIDYYGQP